MSNIQVIQPGQTRTRKRRSPHFPIAGIMKPFGLYPWYVHPVLPGETLEMASTKVRVLSKPIKHPFAGAWLETWMVYVKFTDLDRELGNMFIADDFSTTGYTSAGSARYFTASGQIDWVKMITERFHDAYFLDEGETAQTIDGVRMVKMNNNSWMQNCIFEPTDEAVDTGDIGDLGQQLTGYQMMQLMSMSELTYEDYLKQFGVQSIRTAIGEPEILGYSRSWKQPANVIDPTDGSPSSAWSWSDDIRIDKNKRFDEPGFVVFLSAIRPKMYFGNLTRSMVGELWGFSDWFPAYNIADPTSRGKVIASNHGIVAGGDATPVNIMYDQADLLSHGEQFINCAAGDHPYALPTADAPDWSSGSNSPQLLRGEYATAADVANLFVSATASEQFAFYEGMATLKIAGHIQDFTR